MGFSRRFLGPDQCGPKLADPQVTASALIDVLLDIGEEFRTILWHIQEPKFYSYLHTGEEPASHVNGTNPKG